jgi:hypothetical protein
MSSCPIFAEVAGFFRKLLSQTDQLASFAMDAVWTLQHAKNRFSAVVDAAARGEPQMVRRRAINVLQERPGF